MAIDVMDKEGLRERNLEATHYEVDDEGQLTLYKPNGDPCMVYLRGEWTSVGTIRLATEGRADRRPVPSSEA